MQLSIIISTSNRGNIFVRTLNECIQAIAHVSAEVIVVNDLSDGDIQLPKQAAVPIVCLRSTRRGVAAKRNLGARHARGKLLIFLDDDILTSSDVIDHIMQLHESSPDRCINPNWVYPPTLMNLLPSHAFGRFLMAYDLVSFKGWYGDASWKDNALFSSKSVASFHLSLNKEDFLKTGGYNEYFAEAGFEDYDFPKRLTKANLNFFIDARIHVFHNEEDRTTIRPWLLRQQRGAYTRREAVAMGYQELSIDYGIYKKVAFALIGTVRPVFLLLLKIFSKNKYLDSISFRIILLLQAHSIYKGYSHPFESS